jgi:hypothetical protein
MAQEGRQGEFLLVDSHNPVNGVEAPSATHKNVAAIKAAIQMSFEGMEGELKIRGFVVCELREGDERRLPEDDPGAKLSWRLLALVALASKPQLVN